MTEQEMREAYDDHLLKTFGRLATETPGVGFDMRSAVQRRIQRGMDAFRLGLKMLSRELSEALAPARVIMKLLQGRP